MTKLITKYDATNEVWFAYDNPVESESSRIGQGDSPEDACADYWYQVHKDVAELVYDDDYECWLLYQGCWRVQFSSKAEAINHANANEWQIKGQW